MTLTNDLFGQPEIDCDSCPNHHHWPPHAPPESDPRLSPGLKGWKLDVDGKDYCQECPIPTS